MLMLEITADERNYGSTRDGDVSVVTLDMQRWRGHGDECMCSEGGS